MKVEDGKPFKFRFECRKCRSRLVASMKDVRVGYFGANWGGDTPTREYYVTCLVCGTDRVLKYSETTPKMRSVADQRAKRQ